MAWKTLYPLAGGTGPMNGTNARLPVLTFHALDKRSSVISFSPHLFRDGMARLHEKGYRTLRLSQVAGILIRGEAFPDHSFVITFDDGYESVYEVAFPVLRDCGMSATVFITVGEKGPRKPGSRLPSLEGRPMLTWTQIEEMHRWGIDFGGHTLTHPDLTRLPRDQVQTEVCDGKAVLENILGAPIFCFAYPFGRYNREVQRIVRQSFRLACSDKLGFLKRRSDLFALERVDAYYLRTDRLFKLLLTKLFPWYIGLRGIPRQIRRKLL